MSEAETVTLVKPGEDVVAPELPAEPNPPALRKLYAAPKPAYSLSEQELQLRLPAELEHSAIKADVKERLENNYLNAGKNGQDVHMTLHLYNDVEQVLQNAKEPSLYTDATRKKLSLILANDLAVQSTGDIKKMEELLPLKASPTNLMGYTATGISRNEVIALASDLEKLKAEATVHLPKLLPQIEKTVTHVAHHNEVRAADAAMKAIETNLASKIKEHKNTFLQAGSSSELEAQGAWREASLKKIEADVEHDILNVQHGKTPQEAIKLLKPQLKEIGIDPDKLQQKLEGMVEPPPPPAPPSKPPAPYTTPKSGSSSTSTSIENNKKTIEEETKNALKSGERKWYQFATHNEKAEFSLERTLISSAVLATIGIGYWAIKRAQENNKREETTLTLR